MVKELLRFGRRKEKEGVRLSSVEFVLNTLAEAEERKVGPEEYRFAFEVYVQRRGLDRADAYQRVDRAISALVNRHLGWLGKHTPAVAAETTSGLIAVLATGNLAAYPLGYLIYGVQPSVTLMRFVRGEDVGIKADTALNLMRSIYMLAKDASYIKRFGERAIEAYRMRQLLALHRSLARELTKAGGKKPEPTEHA